MKPGNDPPYYHDNLLIGNRLFAGAYPMALLRLAGSMIVDLPFGFAYR
jgi:hypothetical protein